MSEDDEDLVFCTEVALHIVEGRSVVQRGDGISFYITASRGTLKSYRRLPGDYFVISTKHIPETDEEVRAFWKKHCADFLSGAEAELVSTEDIERARGVINMLFAQAMRDDEALH